MIRKVLLALSAPVLLTALSRPACAEVPDIDAAIARALPAVRDGGVTWIEKRKCVSCHHVSFMTWALGSAARAGFNVSSEDLAAWQQWSHEALLKQRDGEPVTVGSRNLEGVAQILWATRGQNDVLSVETRGKFVQLLLDGQQADGTWRAMGQLPRQKRPEAETALVSTLWNALALGTISDSAQAHEARQKALDAVGAAELTEAASTEWYAVRLLLAVQSNAGDDRASLVARLKSFQRSDGGWGWLIDADSDALATGMALYALRSAGVAPQDDAIRRGAEFLVTSQQKDGSWLVPGTKSQAKNRPVETANYWGTCWAVIGLVESRTSAGG